MSERFWVHCNRAGDGTHVFEVLSEDYGGEPLAIGGPGEESAAVALLVQSGVSRDTAAASCSEARRAGIASVQAGE